jgi:hypothetical protein
LLSVFWEGGGHARTLFLLKVTKKEDPYWYYGSLFRLGLTNEEDGVEGSSLILLGLTNWFSSCELKEKSDKEAPNAPA